MGSKMLPSRRNPTPRSSDDPFMSKTLAETCAKTRYWTLWNRGDASPAGVAFGYTPKRHQPLPQSSVYGARSGGRCAQAPGGFPRLPLREAPCRHYRHRRYTSGVSIKTASPSVRAPARLSEHPRNGSRSLRLAVVALTGATIASLIVGATIVPVEAAHGRFFTDTPPAYQLLVYALGATMILWTVLGVASLITGVRSLMHETAKSRAAWGIALAIASPIVALSVLIVTMLVVALAL